MTAREGLPGDLLHTLCVMLHASEQLSAFLGRWPNSACLVVETEFWGAMDTPNLMVESSAADVADLVAALSLHVGEVARNAYHLRLPAWMMDNVRRGAELVGGQGGVAPRFALCTLYRLRRWVIVLARGVLLPIYD